MTEAWLTALALIVDLARGPQTGLRAQSVCGPFLLIKFYCHPTRQVGTAETTWPTKPKIFAFWPFPEKVCPPPIEQAFLEHCRGSVPAVNRSTPRSGARSHSSGEGGRKGIKRARRAGKSGDGAPSGVWGEDKGGL